MRYLLLLAGAASLSITLAPACGSSTPTSGFNPDGGDDGSSGDGQIGFGDGNGFGDGTNGDGSMGGDPTTCAGATSLHSYIGCDYWPTPVGNAIWSIFDFAVVVANTQSTAATITVTGNGQPMQMTTVAPGQLAKIYLAWNSSLKGPDADNCGNAQNFVTSVSAAGGAYHLVSSVPVTVYQFNALEYAGMGGPTGKSWGACPGNTVCPGAGMAIGCYSFSNDASLLLPSTAMTGNYRLMGIHSINGLGNYFAVTGTQNGTNINVTLSGTATVTAGGQVMAGSPGGTVSFMLNAGDVAEMVGPGIGTTDDMSGSLLKASAPVQVIGGISCISIPQQDPMTGLPLSCDHVEESVFPAETLGKHYVVTVPTGPNGTPVGHLVRVYGNADNTHLTYSPSAPPGCPITVNAGTVIECGIVTNSFEVQGDHEFAVGSFQESAGIVDPNSQPPNQKGDPAMSFATAVEQFRNKYIFLAPSDYVVNFADVVAPSGTTLTLDGAPVGVAPSMVSAGFSVVRIPLMVGSASGAHVITATNPIGIQVLGYGSYTSYQYPGGLDLGQIAPPPVK